MTWIVYLFIYWLLDRISTHNRVSYTFVCNAIILKQKMGGWGWDKVAVILLWPCHLCLLEWPLHLMSELSKLPKSLLWEEALYLAAVDWFLTPWALSSQHPDNFVQTVQHCWRCFAETLHFVEVYFTTRVYHNWGTYGSFSPRRVHPCIFLTAHYTEMFLNNLSLPEDVDVNWC